MKTTTFPFLCLFGLNIKASVEILKNFHLCLNIFDKKLDILCQRLNVIEINSNTFHKMLNVLGQVQEALNCQFRFKPKLNHRFSGALAGLSKI